MDYQNLCLLYSLLYLLITFILREKPYGTIVEGSVGYQEDSHHVSQVLLIDDRNKKFDEKSLLIPNGKSTELLTPFSGMKCNTFSHLIYSIKVFLSKEIASILKQK